MKNRINSEFSFEVWINSSFESTVDETGDFDDNWIVSADDLFGRMDLLADEAINQYDEAA